MPDWAAAHLPNVVKALCPDVRFGSAPSMFAAPPSSSSSSSSSSSAPPQRPAPPPKLSSLVVSFPPLSEPTPSAIAALPALRAELAVLPALTRIFLSTPAAHFLLQHGVTAATATVIGPHVTELIFGRGTRHDALMRGLPPHLATQFPRVHTLRMSGALDDAAAELVLALPTLQRFTCGAASAQHAHTAA